VATRKKVATSPGVEITDLLAGERTIPVDFVNPRGDAFVLLMTYSPGLITGSFVREVNLNLSKGLTAAITSLQIDVDGEPQPITVNGEPLRITEDGLYEHLSRDLKMRLYAAIMTDVRLGEPDASSDAG
jgi:hypothetical protein